MRFLDPDERQQRILATIQCEFSAARAARVAALVRAQVAIMSGSLTVGQVAFALGITRGSFHRWQRDLGLRELALECVIEVDQALRATGARNDDNTTENLTKDQELALGSIGVWKRSE